MKGISQLKPGGKEWHGHQDPFRPDNPPSGTLRALRIIHLHIVNLRIIPATWCVVDIEMSLDLPIDVDHRTTGAMVRNQNINLRRPILLIIAARNAAPDTVSTVQKDRL